jgi:hypothetical protein
MIACPRWSDSVWGSGKGGVGEHCGVAVGGEQLAWAGRGGCRGEPPEAPEDQPTLGAVGGLGGEGAGGHLGDLGIADPGAEK